MISCVSMVSSFSVESDMDAAAVSDTALIASSVSHGFSGESETASSNTSAAPPHTLQRLCNTYVDRQLCLPAEGDEGRIDNSERTKELLINRTA